jgi:hypothetical protein
MSNKFRWIAGFDCLVPDESFDSIWRLLALFNPNHIGSLALKLYGDVSGDLFKLDRCLGTLSNLKEFHLYVFNKHNGHLELSCFGNGLKSIQSVVLECENHDVVVHGLISFPWKSCTSIILHDLSIPLVDWQLILKSLRKCETITLKAIVFSTKFTQCNSGKAK